MRVGILDLRLRSNRLAIIPRVRVLAASTIGEHRRAAMWKYVTPGSGLILLLRPYSGLQYFRFPSTFLYVQMLALRFAMRFPP